MIFDAFFDRQIIADWAATQENLPADVQEIVDELKPRQLIETPKITNEDWLRCMNPRFGPLTRIWGVQDAEVDALVEEILAEEDAPPYFQPVLPFRNGDPRAQEALEQGMVVARVSKAYPRRH
jgi:hypothetical protein